MKKLLLVFALLISRCSVQPVFALSCPNGLTEIRDTAVVNAANGQPYTGSITITQTADSLQGTSTVLGDQQTVTVTVGSLDVCVSPGRFSSRQRAAGSALTITGAWIVPSSGGPYRLTDIPTGTVSTVGTAVTSTAPINFMAVAATDTVRIAGLPYQVCSVQSATALTLCGLGAGSQAGASFSDGPIEQIAATPALAAMYTGAIGPVGATGATGAASTVPGPSGATGAQGPIGATGAASTVPGPTGPQGVIGPTGLSGTGNAPYYQTVSALTTLTVAASTHLQGVHPVGFCFDASTHQIACDPAPDSSGNLTFSWPGGFTGSITILGGGTGATGATGAQGTPGPTGPMGSLSGFGSPPTTAGIYCTQVTVTAGPSYAYGWGACGGSSALSYAALTNSQYTGMTNSQYTGMTN